MHKRYGERFPGVHVGMLWLQNVPGFEYVYIHVGNVDDETEGCILVGDGVHSNVIEDGKLSASVSAYQRLYQEMLSSLLSATPPITEAHHTKGEEVWLTIVDVG